MNVISMVIGGPVRLLGSGKLPCRLSDVEVSSTMVRVIDIGSAVVVITSFSSEAAKVHSPEYVPKVPLPSTLNLISPEKPSRIPPGPVASTPLAFRLTGVQVASVRNLNLSDSSSLHEYAITRVAMIRNDATFFITLNFKFLFRLKVTKRFELLSNVMIQAFPAYRYKLQNQSSLILMFLNHTLSP